MLVSSSINSQQKASFDIPFVKNKVGENRLTVVINQFDNHGLVATLEKSMEMEKNTCGLPAFSSKNTCVFCLELPAPQENLMSPTGKLPVTLRMSCIQNFR